MMIKDLGTGVESAWDGLRPITRQMLVGILKSRDAASPNPASAKFSYDAHADWELSRLLSALDARRRSADLPDDQHTLKEMNVLAETCAHVLEAQSASAEVFIQLAERAISRRDYDRLDKLADRLSERFTAGEIAEIIRQSDTPQIRAIAYETLAMAPVSALEPLLDDSLYSDIVANALEQKAFEFNSDEAREILDEYDSEIENRGDF